MSIISIAPPFPVFTDREGEPLEGYLYIGTVGFNPLIPVNQSAIYSDVALTIPVAQPVRVSGGYPVNNSGSPIRIYVGTSDYSIAVLDAGNALVFSSLDNKTKLGLIDLSTDVTGLLPSTAIKYDRTAAEIAAGVTPTNYTYPPGNVLRYGADQTGIADSTAAFQRAVDSNDSVWIPAGTYLLNQTVVASQLAIKRSNVSMIGAGPGATILKHTATGVVTGNQGVVNLFPSSGTISGIYLANFKIEGPTANTGAAPNNTTRVLGLLIHDGASSYDVTDCLIENVTIEKMEMACFALTGISTGLPRRITFLNCNGGKCRQDVFNDFAAGDDIRWIDCNAYDSDGFSHEHASAPLLIQGGTARRMGQAAVGIEYNSTLGANKWRTITGLTISDTGTAASPDAPAFALGQAFNPFKTIIQGCNAQRLAGGFVKINGVPDSIAVVDNFVQDIGGGGVDKVGVSTAAAGTNLTVKNNTFKVLTGGYFMTYGVAFAGAGDISNVIDNNEVVGATTARVSADYPSRLGRRLISAENTTPVGNVGGGEDDLITYTMPALQVDADGQVFRITARGYTAANANNKTLKAYLNGVTIYDSGAVAANNKPWSLNILVIRTSSTAANIYVEGQYNGALIAAARVSAFGTLAFGSAQVLKCTGTGTADNDIVQEGLLVEFLDGR